MTRINHQIRESWSSVCHKVGDKDNSAEGSGLFWLNNKVFNQGKLDIELFIDFFFSKGMTRLRSGKKGNTSTQNPELCQRKGPVVLESRRRCFRRSRQNRAWT